MTTLAAFLTGAVVTLALAGSFFAWLVRKAPVVPDAPFVAPARDGKLTEGRR